MAKATVKIGKLVLDGNLILAPMAGYTDAAFRLLCRREGAALCITEMLHASRIVKTEARCTKGMEDTPSCIQLFANNPDDAGRACRIAEKDCDAISFNFGCPSEQIKQSGCGAALLDNPELIGRIVSALRKSTVKPLLMKMRLGNKSKAGCEETACIIEKAGADALIIHGRTASQGYSGKADWHAIAGIVRKTGIPVFANGDVVDGKSAKECLEVTGAAGLAIGRAALGNPVIFSQISAYLEDDGNDNMKSIIKPKFTAQSRLEFFKEYLNIAKCLGFPRAQIIRQAMVFTKGIRRGAELREKIARMAVDDIVKHIEMQLG